MANNLETRITALERKSQSNLPLCVLVTCKGDKPDSEEQTLIDEHEARGRFVIVQTIIDPHPSDLDG